MSFTSKNISLININQNLDMYNFQNFMQSEEVDIIIEDLTTKKTLNLYLSLDAKMSEARLEILKDWKGLEFSFVSKGQIQGTGAQSKKTINKIIEKINDENKIYIQSKDLSGKNEKNSGALEMLILSDKSNLNQQKKGFKINTNDTLDNLRLQVQKTKPWNKLDFNFYSQDGIVQLSIESEKNTSIYEIIQKGNIFQIKSRERKKDEQDSNTNKEELLKDIQKTKKAVNEALDELDKFAEKYKKQAAQKKKIQESDIENIRKKLEPLNIVIESNQFQWSSLKDKVLEIKQEKDSFLQQINSNDSFSTRDLVMNFAQNICIGYYHGNKTKFSVVDFAQTKHYPDNQCKDYKSNIQIFQNSQKAKKFQAQTTTRLHSGELKIGAASVVAVVSAGMTASASSSQKKQQFKSQQGKSYDSVHTVLSINQGINIDPKSIYLKKEIIDEYTGYLLKFQKNKGKKDHDLDDRIQNFLKNYGYKIELGTYLFGSTYFYRNSLNWNKKQSYATRQQIATKSFNAAVKGGGFYGGALIAGSASYNYNNEKGQKTKEQSSKQSYSYSESFNCIPPIKNIDDWKQCIMMSKKWWKILGKNVQEIQIFRLFHEPQNSNETIISMKSQDKLYRFENYIRYIYDKQQQKNTIKSQEKINIVLFGPSGSGKSTIGNQLFGQSMKKPFTTSDKATSCTGQLILQENNQERYIDTPGIFDNTDKKPGELQRQISSVINQNQKVNHKNYRKVSAFLLVTKPNPRVEVQSTILKFEQYFGKRALDSAVLVFNYRSYTDMKKAKDEVLSNAQLNQILKKYSMDPKTQIFFNYLFDSNKKYLEEFASYRYYKEELIDNIKTLPEYTSDHYKKYLKSIEDALLHQKAEQANKKAAQQKARKQEQLKTANKIKEDIIKRFSDNFNRFVLKHVESDKYVSYGTIHGFWGMGEKGFSLYGISQLYLDKCSLSYDNASIQGYLTDTCQPMRKACTNEGGYVGYRILNEHYIQQVTIKFQQGTQAFHMLMFRGRVNVTVSISGYYMAAIKNQLRLVTEFDKKTCLFEMAIA